LQASAASTSQRDFTARAHAAHFTYLTSARPSFAQVLKERGAAAAASAESMAAAGVARGWRRSQHRRPREYRRARNVRVL